jgi:hypothetical protein
MDPELVLLEIAVSGIDYWLVPRHRIVRALHALKALATGRRYESGQRGSIAMSP